MKGSFFLLLLVSHVACCQLVQTTVPATVRLDAYDNRLQNALAFVANQAALGGANQFAAALYGEKRFLLQELSVYQMAVAQPAGAGAFGLHVFYSGNVDYNTTEVAFAYGRNLGEKWAAGVQFDYWNQHIRGYGNAAQLTVEGALLVQVSETLSAGVQVCNAAGVVFNKWDQKRPAVYTIGTSYRPSQNVTISAELIKVEKFPVAVQAGIGYHFTEKLWVKAGINSSTAAFFIAGGFQLNDFSIEVIGAVHPQLGLSPGVLLAYNAMEK